MFEVDKFLYKPSFGDLHHCDPCHPHHEPEHHCPPRYTMTEEVEHTARLMRETIDRLLKFEERAKAEIAKLSKQVMSDNVIFKNTMYEAYNGFLMEVKNEINIFEGNIEADIKLFKQEIETNYANLADTINTRIAEFESKYEKEMTELNTSIQNQYNAFIEAVNERIDLNNENMSQAFAEYQRQLTTEMNTFQQNMTANYESFTESIGNSFHEFRQNWEETMTQRFAAQDGKISDAEAYMKTNLGATVTTLIGDMHSNGDFTEIIEGEVFNDLEMRSKLEYHEANEEIGLATCAAYCRANKRVFYVPYGKTVNVEETLDLTGMDVEVNGTLNITHHGVGVIVGDVSTAVMPRKIVINAVTHTAYQTQDISVRIQGLMNGDVFIGNAPYVQLYADGDTDYASIAYSNFHVGKCNVLQITDKVGSTNPGWINENTFYNCRICKQLLINGFEYNHNNNVFYKPCLENASMILKKCSRNKFYDVRTEGNFVFNADKDTRQNIIVNNFYYSNPTNMGMQIGDDGFGNIITNDMFNELHNVDVYVMTPQTLNKNLYEVAEKEKFSATDELITPSQSWAKICEGVLPVKHIKYLMLNADKSSFRMRLTPMDANKNVITGGLSYSGATQASGVYDTGANTGFAVAEITDKNVAFVKMEVSVGGGSYYPFTAMAVKAFYDPNRFYHASALREFFKTAITV